MAYYHTGSSYMTGPRGRARGRGSVAESGNWRMRGPMNGENAGPRASRWRTSSILDEQEARNTFQIKWPESYQGVAPLVGQPEVLGSYSVDEDRKFLHDESQLDFIDMEYLPVDGEKKVHMDLNKGMDKFIDFSGGNDDSFQSLLQWILSNECILKTHKSSSKLDADFISVRKTFSKIMGTPYCIRDTWTLSATEFKGSIYMKMQTEVENVEKHEVDPQVKKLSLYGHKFEHIMKGGKPEENVVANEEYRCVLRMKVDQISLIHASKLDFADPEQFEEDFKDLNGFLMVSCAKEVKTPFSMKSYKKFKLNQWWIRGILSGIPRCVIGYRNDDGIVHTLKLLKTDEIPLMAEDEWKPNVCINFFVSFLNFVKSKVREDPTAVHRFHRKPKGNIHWSKLPNSSHMTLLPSWFTEQLFSSKDTKNDSE